MGNDYYLNYREKLMLYRCTHIANESLTRFTRPSL